MSMYFSHGTYEPSKTFHLEQLKKESDYVISDLKRLEEARQKLEAYLGSLGTRASEVLEYNYYYLVEIYRYHNYSNHIEYGVALFKAVEGKNFNETKMLIESKKFIGKERKLALNYAEELKLKYSAETKKNF